jgi:glutamine cyclotransferase
VAHSEIVDRFQANVWFEDVLLVIDPETGKVEKEYGTSIDIFKVAAFVKTVVAQYGTCLSIPTIDFSTLWPKSERRKHGADVFNGISVSEDDDVLYVTGKKWNRIYSVKLNV